MDNFFQHREINLDLYDPFLPGAGKPVDAVSFQDSTKTAYEPYAGGATSVDDVSSSRSTIVHKQHPIRQIAIAAISLVMTTILFLLTIIYSTEKSPSLNLPLLYSSSSNTIFVLSVLSGLTGVSLAVTVSIALERLMWMILSADGGIMLPEYLSLHASTGVLGLLHLSFGGWRSVRILTRVMSLGRLMLMLLVPISGIVIMSDINTKLAFAPLKGAVPFKGWGVLPFNATLANNVSLISDQVSLSVMFVGDPARSVDITPRTQRLTDCAQNPDFRTATRCRRVYYLPGGVEYAFSGIKGDQRSGALLAMNQQGYVLEYTEGEPTWTFEADECQVYGFPFAAFHLCIANENASTVRARIVHCPTSVSSPNQCRNESVTSWYTNLGWSAKLQTSFRRADVAYSRQNGSILSHTFTSNASPIPVDANGMLTGLSLACGNFRELTDLISLFFGPIDNPLSPTGTTAHTGDSSESNNLFSLYVYPAFVWSWLKGVTTLHSDPAMATRGAETIQSLLAVILYYSQPSPYARGLSHIGEEESGASSAGITPEIQQFAADLLAIAPPDTDVAIAAIGWQIEVGRSTLIAFALMCGTALVLCLVVFIVGLTRYNAEPVPGTGVFPVWDAWLLCKIVKSEQDGVEDEPNKSLKEGKVSWGEDDIIGPRPLKRMKSMRVTLIDK